MTVSNYKKVFKQLKAKPVKLKRFLKHSSPKERTCGIGKKRCERCGRAGGHISKYGLNLCRQCFREISTKIGFKKYS
ncbi:MAG: 30S ribosomal protein S14 [Nanoarchaeota archaeon]|nr:30S ribosomal protein S14 [Nanoarchaeota archaeon]